MRKNLSLTLVLILVLTMATAYADITFSGDARVRPRMDVKTYGENAEKTVTDNYYYYRARLNVMANMSEGYYFKTQLGTNGVATWTGKFGTGSTPSGSSIPSAGRGTLSFLQLYFGHKGDAFGWSAGIIPVSGNSMTDFHYYPTIALDIPWVIYNNSAASGFNFYYMLAGNKLDLKVIVDDNLGVVTDDVGDSLDVTTKDAYSIHLNYPVKFAGVKISPEFIKTLGDEGKASPMTFGAEVALPKMAGFGFSMFAGLTSQTVVDAGTYAGFIARGKLVGKVGPGSITAWYDMAKLTDTSGDVDVITNFSYIWLAYKYTAHKSDQGSLTFAPTIRIYNKNTDTDGVMSGYYSRSKFELTTEVKF